MERVIISPIDGTPPPCGVVSDTAARNLWARWGSWAKIGRLCASSAQAVFGADHIEPVPARYQCTRN